MIAVEEERYHDPTVGHGHRDDLRQEQGTLPLSVGTATLYIPTSSHFLVEEFPCCRD